MDWLFFVPWADLNYEDRPFLTKLEFSEGQSSFEGWSFDFQRIKRQKRNRRDEKKEEENKWNQNW